MLNGQQSALSRRTRQFLNVILFPFIFIFVVCTLGLIWSIFEDVSQELLAMARNIFDADLSSPRDVAGLFVGILAVLSPLYHFRR
jgi:hypothetical protein